MFYHRTVLQNEAVEALNVKDGGVYVDATLGGGGHSEAILSRLGAGLLIGIDQDDQAIAAAKERLSREDRSIMVAKEPLHREDGANAAGRIHLQRHEPTEIPAREHLDRHEGTGTRSGTRPQPRPGGVHMILVRDNFARLDSILDEQGIETVDGILFDLGVSSPQLDTVERGFRYQEDAPLDMRMDRRGSVTAYEIVNEWLEEDLARIIRDYGEERFARAIARRIVERRKREPIATTGELAEVIKEAIPAPARRTGPHPAKRTFQAIRIAVNRELDVLHEALHQAVKHLAPEGRIAVISFHSLEDRIVKETFQEYATGCTCPPDFPICVCGKKPTLKIITKKPILPTETEIEENPRARSAKLRVAEKLLHTT